jgi:hypothetical protein
MEWTPILRQPVKPWNVAKGETGWDLEGSSPGNSNSMRYNDSVQVSQRGSGRSLE